MKVQPVAGPSAVQQAPSNAPTLKARAVAAFNQANSQEGQQAQTSHSAQLNQNAISVEDLSAIQQPNRQPDPSVESLEATTETLTEQTPMPESTKPVEDPALSRQFAQLARQEKALRQRAQAQDQALRQREEQLKTREAALTSKDEQYKSGYFAKDQLKSDPLTVLAEAGISYDDIVQQVLNQQPKDPRVEATISRLESKIRSLEEQNEVSRKSYADQQTQAYQAAVKQIRLDVDALVSSDPEFETIKTARASKDVVELITQTYDKDGILLTVEEAAKQVEDYLMEEAMKFTQINKIKSRLATSAQSSKSLQQTQQAQKPQTQPTMKTLTNSTSSSRKLSARERAMLAFKGEKQS